MASTLSVDLVSLPHVRGGVSGGATLSEAGKASSPRAWGCFFEKRLYKAKKKVFPTCVGVFPSAPPTGRDAPWSSPRAWGCFARHLAGRGELCVFPTCVGVFPDEEPHFERGDCLPHVRGGVSYVCASCGRELASSPRAWGCFWLIEISTYVDDVFPTHVGCF